MTKVLLFLLSIFLVILSFTNPPSALVGRWQKRLPNGIVLGVFFRSDSSYLGSLNGKIFVNGKYYMQQDTFAVSDPGCGLTYYGTYKFQFFANDSVRFTAIQDTCRGRRRGSDGLTLGRVQSGQVK